MEKLKVLLVEDEVTLSMIIKETLEEKDEFIVHTAKDGEEGFQKYHMFHPDVIVSDVMMPRMDGFDFINRLRETDTQTPVLFLTARSSVDDVVQGFTLGGNDYLKKPFGMNELIIRIKNLTNRISVKNTKTNTYNIGTFVFDSVTQNLFHNGEKITLSNRETEILKRLCENKNQVLHTKSLLLELWGDDGYFTTRSLHVFITKLRQKLAVDPSICILNVRGTGYKLIEDESN